MNQEEYDHWKAKINELVNGIDNLKHLIYKSDKTLFAMKPGSRDYLEMAKLRYSYEQDKRRYELKLIEIRKFVKDNYNEVYQHLQKNNMMNSHNRFT